MTGVNSCFPRYDGLGWKEERRSFAPTPAGDKPLVILDICNTLRTFGSKHGLNVTQKQSAVQHAGKHVCSKQ